MNDKPPSSANPKKDWLSGSHSGFYPVSGWLTEERLDLLDNIPVSGWLWSLRLSPSTTMATRALRLFDGVHRCHFMLTRALAVLILLCVFAFKQ
jgi:hypothetical protein